MYLVIVDNRIAAQTSTEAGARAMAQTLGTTATIAKVVAQYAVEPAPVWTEAP